MFISIHPTIQLPQQQVFQSTSEHFREADKTKHFNQIMFLYTIMPSLYVEEGRLHYNFIGYSIKTL